ncbi:DUF6755 family protein [uncultured Paludibaculum sp.]|uniref:DUF6755 family protein n=1 Tax=uncultured Paludibaculum sp. TaxID=1765020 RepID=UPI002AAB5D6D|nr:DUF6755 family protein [uncultured Paludibaculum sp.]
MAFYDSPTRKRAARAMDGAMLLLVVLLVVQVWLLMASVESWLAGHRQVVLPAMLLSGFLFAGCVGLLALARRTDKTARHSVENTTQTSSSISGAP